MTAERLDAVPKLGQYGLSYRQIGGALLYAGKPNWSQLATITPR